MKEFGNEKKRVVYETGKHGLLRECTEPTKRETEAMKGESRVEEQVKSCACKCTFLCVSWLCYWNEANIQ